MGGRADQRFELAVSLMPEDDDARQGMARAWMRMGKVEEAATELEGIAQRRPDDPSVWLALGSAWGKLGRNDEAVTAFDRAIELAPSMQSAHVQKIGALVLADRCKEAKQAHKKLKKQGPSDRAKRAVKNALKACG